MACRQSHRSLCQVVQLAKVVYGVLGTPPAFHDDATRSGSIVEVTEFNYLRLSIACARASHDDFLGSFAARDHTSSSIASDDRFLGKSLLHDDLTSAS